MNEDFPDIHPRGVYHVDLPYERVRVKVNGMNRGHPDIYGWIHEHCAPVEIRTFVRPVKFCRETMKSEKVARIMFLHSHEAVLFKLTWA